MNQVHIIILASGRGRRFGSNKLLALLNGEPIISYTFSKLDLLRKSDLPWLGQIHIVTDHQGVKSLAKGYGFDVIHNPKADEGIAASIRYGTSAIMPSSQSDGLLFWVGDQPLLSLDSIYRLVDHFIAMPNQAVVLSYGERLGNPVIFPLRFREELLSLSGEQGGKLILKKYPHQYSVVMAEGEEELMDIDLPSDILQIEKTYGNFSIKI